MTTMLFADRDPLDADGDNEDALGILERPKRPLSAYNMFFRDEREKLLESLPTPPTPSTDSRRKRKGDKSHRKINFADLAKTIAARWRKIDDEVKTKYEASAQVERQAYNEKAKAWRQQCKALGISTKRGDKKGAGNKSKVKQEVGPPMIRRGESNTRPDLLGPSTRRKLQDPNEVAMAQSDYSESAIVRQDDQSPIAVNYYREDQMAPAGPVTAFSGLNVGVESFTDDDMGVVDHGGFPPGQAMGQAISPFDYPSPGQSDLAFYRHQRAVMPSSPLMHMDVYTDGMNANPNTAFFSYPLNHYAWRSPVIHANDGGAYERYSQQDNFLAYNAARQQDNGCFHRPVNAFED